MKYRIKAALHERDIKRGLVPPIEVETWSMKMANETIRAFHATGYHLFQILDAETSSVIYERVRDEVTVDKRNKYLLREVREYATSELPAPPENT